MNALKKLVNARWFPTVTTPLATGALASAVLVGLQALGITSAPDVVVAAVTPFVGFLVAAITQHPDTTTAPEESTKPSVGQTLGGVISEVIIEALDSDPNVGKSLALGALEHVLHPLVPTPSSAPAGAQEVVNTGNLS